MLIALYFLLANGDEFVAWLDRISPLRAGQSSSLDGQQRMCRGMPRP
jgi:hypothetical protein